MLRRICIAFLLLLITAPSAFAVDPYAEVSGNATAKWFSGSLIQQEGLNCSTAILGSAYTEVMVSGIGSFGGLAQAPRVNQGYWTSLLLSIPGNPCGPGSTSVITDLVLPPNTIYDNTRPIRCFGQGRTASTFSEITGESWTFLGTTGRYCPTTAIPSSQHLGALNFGFRTLASGQMFQIFVPVKSSQQLIGIGATPADGFRWLTDATGVYANPGLSTVWANVFASAGGGTPSVFFSREPSAAPFWKADGAATPFDSRNRIELWANVYTGGLGGTLCYEIRRISDNSLRATCSIDPGFNPTVPTGFDTVQVKPDPAHTGPNGGYVPLWFDGPDRPDPEWNQAMRITWTFTTTANVKYSRSIDFRTLAGPDSDGDGVADSADACPTVKGTLSNGCLPAVQGDDDNDGAFGANDLCPTVHGNGSADGCPVAAALPAATKPVILGGALSVRRFARLKRSQLLTTGAVVPIRCTVNSKASGTLSITRAVAAQLKIRTAKKTIVIGTATSACTTATGAKLRFKYTRAYKRALTRSRVRFVGTLGLKLTNAAGSATARPVAIKVY